MSPVNDIPVPKTIPRVGVAFLLSQVGAYAAYSFEDGLLALDLKPHHAGLLRMLASNPGLTQRVLCGLFGIFPSRLVLLLDRLEKRGFIERRSDPSDRRSYRVHLTKAGRKALAAIGKVTRQLEGDLCGALNRKERAQLTAFLERIVADRRITPAVHPAYRKCLDQ
jgi:DNA-binding MarR family transcriptional regulator